MRTVVACLLFATAAPAAPVPRVPVPDPVPVSPVGTWDYAWGDQRDGRITFHPDGTYHAHHAPELVVEYVGTWTFDGATVRLREYRLRPGGAIGGPTDYAFTVAPGGAGLTGTTPGGTVVELSEPKGWRP